MSQRRTSIQELPEDERPNNTAGYKIAPKVGIDELLKKDADDVALQKYKESLLGSSNQSKNKFPNDERYIIVENFSINFDDHPALSFNPNTGKPPLLKIKEGTAYRIKIRFYCQHNLVSGLKFINIVSNGLGIRLDKQENVLGSYAPQLEAYERVMDEEVAPEGFFARGSYKAKCRLIDDDSQIHNEFDYAFDITSDW